MSKRAIILISAILLAIIAFIFWRLNRQNVPISLEELNAQNSSTSTESISTENSGTSSESSTLSQSEQAAREITKDTAWQLFQTYLEFAKNRNAEGIRQIVYKVAPVCENPEKTKDDCDKRMDSAYYFGSQLKKEDFVNVWSDRKQIIMATNFNVTSDEYSIQRSRAIMFFIKDSSGNLKLLSFSPTKGVIVDKNSNASSEELNTRVVRYTEDNDNDGMPDYQEECLTGETGCVKTSTKLRDSNNNGWWDGVEALMN